MRSGGLQLKVSLQTLPRRFTSSGAAEGGKGGGRGGQEAERSSLKVKARGEHEHWEGFCADAARSCAASRSGARARMCWERRLVMVLDLDRRGVAGEDDGS